MISGAFKYRGKIGHNYFKHYIFVVFDLCNSGLPVQNWFCSYCGNNELEKGNFWKVTDLNEDQIVSHHDRFSSFSSASQNKFMSNWIIFQQDATVFCLLHICRQLYMFRVLTPIIRSSYNCNYNFWHWPTGSATFRSRCWVLTQQRERMVRT